MNKKEAMFLYCVVAGGAATDFGKMGIEDAKVYTVPYKDVAAVVHACDAKPYESKDKEKVEEWILSFQYIIDAATRKSGTVIPFTFDTIIKGDEKDVLAWLEKEYKALKGQLMKFKGRSEFSVQIFWDEEVIKEKIRKTNEELRKLEEEIKNKPKGVAYMLGRKKETVQREGLRKEAEKYSKDFYEEIGKYVEGINVERPQSLPDEWKDKQILLALSCLVHKDEVEKLGETLGKINDKKAFSVRFTGPWAPFSFVQRGN